jgi:hypothetical protein
MLSYSKELEVLEIPIPSAYIFQLLNSPNQSYIKTIEDLENYKGHGDSLFANIVFLGAWHTMYADYDELKHKQLENKVLNELIEKIKNKWNQELVRWEESYYFINQFGSVQVIRFDKSAQITSFSTPKYQFRRSNENPNQFILIEKNKPPVAIIKFIYSKTEDSYEN